MQRSNKLKSSGPLNGPPPKLLLPAVLAAIARLRCRGERRYLAVGRIGDEPRATALGHFVDVAEFS